MDRADGGFYPKVFALVTAGLLGYALVLMAMPFAGAITQNIQGGAGVVGNQ